MASSRTATMRETSRVHAVPSLPSAFDRRELAAIFAGGCAGGVVRAALEQTLGGGAPGWPWTTFAVNVAGAFLLGYFATRLQERLPLSSYRRPLLGTGLCGGLTTFSTVQIELLRMLDAGAYARAAGYAAASVAAGYAALTIAGALGVSTLLWIGVALCGGAGSLLRFVVDAAVSARVGRGLPLGTLVVNATGAAALGLVTGLALSGDALLLVGTATIGSYTTFSTWMLESQRLAEDGEARRGMANVVISIAVGLAAAVAGRALGTP
jgi:CrcB protein